MLVALNMSDVAKERGYKVDRAALSQALGIPVIETVDIRSGGERGLLEAIEGHDFSMPTGPVTIPPAPSTVADIEATQREVRPILDAIGYRVPARLAMLSR